MKTVHFVRPTKLGTLYNTGETAGFDEALADHLVQQGFAEFLSSEEAKPSKEKKEAT